MENQLITINENNLLQILKSYYLKEDADVSISTKKENIGYYETESCVTKILVKRKINISGVENTIVETLDENELKGILSEVLFETGIEVESLELLNNLKRKTVGYGMAEHTELCPEFNGVKLRVKPSPVKRLGRNKI